MNKYMFLYFAILFLITACSGPSQITPQPIPTPSINYQIVGSTMNIYMLVVDPSSGTDRAGLQSVSDYLCHERNKICIIWFWDDINKAGTSYPIDPSNEGSRIAVYKYDPVTYQDKLVIYSLGDK